MTTTERTPGRLGSILAELPRAGRFLLLAVAVDALGIGLVLPFGVVYLHEVRHLPLSTVGLLLSVPPAVALVLVAPFGTLIDAVGSRRIQLLSVVFSGVGVTLLSQAHHELSAGVALAFMGVGQAAFWPANTALISTTIPPELRQRYFGLNFTVLNAGIGVGGVIAGLLVDVRHPWTFEAIYLGDAVTFLVPLGVLLFVVRDVGGAPAAVQGAGDRDLGDDDSGHVVATSPASYVVVLRDRTFRRLLAVTFGAAFVGYAQLEAGWTAFARVVGGLPTWGIGLAFAGNTALIVLLQLPMLKRIQGHRRTRLLMVMAGIWLVSWCCVGVGGLVGGGVVSIALLVASAGIFGVGETIQSPVVPALLNDLASDQLRGRYNAANSLAFQVAGVLGPATAGLLIGNGWDAAYIGLMLVGCGAIVALLVLLERQVPASVNLATA